MKALDHAAGRCPGDYRVRFYLCIDGVIRWLCSACNMPGDREIPP